MDDLFEFAKRGIAAQQAVDQVIASRRARTFDRKEGDRLAEEGIALASSKERRQALLKMAREIAREIAEHRPEREVTMDAVQAIMIRRGHDPAELGNAAGSVFKSAEWEFTGRYKKSERVSRHSNVVRIWRLKETD